MEPTLVTETSEEKTQKPEKFPEESTLITKIIQYNAATSPKHWAKYVRFSAGL
jgi:hypothetical protein